MNATHCIPWNADCSICNPPETETAGKVIDLMEVLKRSLAKSRRAAPPEGGV